MKNKANQITLIYIITSIFMAFASYELLQKHTSQVNYYYTKDIVFILFSGIFIKYVLYKKNVKNTAIFKKLKDSNDEIKKSNERYDIVAKATSDTIWDWKIQEDCLTWNKGIENVFGYKQTEVGKSSKWWFENIHPEDSIKMSVKLYSFTLVSTIN